MADLPAMSTLERRWSSRSKRLQPNAGPAANDGSALASARAQPDARLLMVEPASPAPVRKRPVTALA